MDYIILTPIIQTFPKQVGDKLTPLYHILTPITHTFPKQVGDRLTPFVSYSYAYNTNVV